MDKLLELLKDLFDPQQLQRVIFKLVQPLLDGVNDPKGCKDHLLDLLERGEMLSHLKQDPLCVILCTVYVLLELADHQHQPDVIGATPDQVQYYQRLGKALGVPQPQTGLSDIFLKILMEKLAELLKELLDEWLNNEQD